jgi:hypothetical protein
MLNLSCKYQCLICHVMKLCLICHESNICLFYYVSKLCPICHVSKLYLVRHVIKLCLMCHISKLSLFWHVSKQCLIARQMEALTVTNNTTESGEERSIFSIILESTFPGNCSGNGHCIDGKFSFCWWAM